MIKLVLWGVRRPGLTAAEYFDGNHRVHGGLIRRAPEDFAGQILRYTQSYVFDAAYGRTGAKAFDSVSELWFDGPQTLGANFAHPYYQQVILPDGSKFADEAANVVHVATEEIVGEAPLRGQGVKVLHWLKAADGVPLDDWEAWWTDAHAEARDGLDALGHTRNRVPPGAPAMVGEGPTAYDAFWLDGHDDIPAFQAYARRLTAAGVAAGVLDADAGLYLLCHERRVVDAIPDSQD